MRSIQAVRVCAAAAIVSAALVFVPGAGAGITPLPLPGPAVAVSGNRAAVAWTADGVVQLATLQADGTFSAGEGVGRTLDGRAPRLALTPAGDELLIWQSGGVLRSALRTAGHDTWTYETIASGVNDYSPPQLVIGSDGRATASWMGLGGALLVSTRSANGWGAPMLVAAASSQSSLAVDSAGDVALVFQSQGTSATAAGLWATLAAGANAWTAPVLISGSDVLPNGGYGLSVDGGGARTFVATWGISRPASAQNVQPLTRAARLRIPGTWEAPQDVVLPTLDPQLASTAFAGDWASGVDSLGNALAVVRFPTLAQGFALGATALAASGDAWTGPVTSDFPAERYSSDSAPSLAFADDGSATVAFLRSERDNFQMRIATSSAPFGTWLGQTVGMTFTGPDWSLDPVVAADSRVGAIALQSARGDLVAFARNAPGVAWTGPQTLKSTGGTTGYLAGAHVKRGVAQIVVRCGLPPCQGVVLLQAALRSGRRQLARVSFSFAAAGSKTRPISLPAWARARMRHGQHLLTHFALTVHEGDGTSEQIQRTIRLHG